MSAKKILCKIFFLSSTILLTSLLCEVNSQSKKVFTPYSKGKVKYTVHIPNLKGKVILSLWTLLDTQQNSGILVYLPQDNGKTFHLTGTTPGSYYIVKEEGTNLISIEDPTSSTNHSKIRRVVTDDNGNATFPIPISAQNSPQLE